MKRIIKDNRYYVLIDAGGTYIKSIILNRAKEVVPHSNSVTKIDSLGSREYILESITQIIQKYIVRIAEYGKLDGIAFSFPGPFDYKNGISLMDHKYQRILGINLRKEMISRLKLPKDFHVLFEEDSVAFIKGEIGSDNFHGINRIIGITLGTGLGSAFMAEGTIVKNGPSVPVFGELWDFPDGNGILEDSISSRAIMKIYRDVSGISEEKKSDLDVEKIAAMAKSGDVNSIRSFNEFGRIMGKKLKIHAENFQAECLIVGGQIAKSFELFSGPLEKELSSVITIKRIMQAQYINDSIFYGLLDCFDGEK